MKLNLKEISKPIIAPSLLAADRQNLVLESKKAEAFGAKFLHIDVMDGKFVPNVSFGIEEIKKITHEHSILNDVHLMIEEPYKYIKDYHQAGADLITFHYEACLSEEEVHKTIELIHSFGLYAGLSIKPMTDVKKLLPFADEIDLILLMSVEPGKGGQKFMSESLTRLDEIAELLKDKKDKPLIEIDGGINFETGKKALEHGAEVLVAGSYLYGHNDMEEVTKSFMQIALFALMAISALLTLAFICFVLPTKKETDRQFNFRQYFMYEAFGGTYGTITRGLFYAIIFINSISSIIMAFTLPLDESITSRGYYILFAGFHLATEVFLVLLSVLSFKQEKMRIVSFVLFGCFLTISNGSAAIILMSIANRLGGYRETMPLILAGLCIFFAIASFVPLLNPKLSNYAKLVPVTEKDGTSHLERPKYFVMAISEWILFFVMEVSIVSELVFFMATCN